MNEKVKAPEVFIPLAKGFFPDELSAWISNTKFDFLFYPETGFDDLQKFFVQTVLDFDFSIPFFQLDQQHGDEIIDITEDLVAGDKRLFEADAVITRLKEIPVMVRTADCNPIFIYSPENEVIGLVHAGWRGTDQKILVKTLKKIQQTYGGSYENMKIYIGPSIRKCCYEVKEDMMDRFEKFISKRKNRLYLDLIECNGEQAVDLGLKADHILIDHRCTSCCEKEFFSHRRIQGYSGRMLSVLVKR